ncbi:hypothetical protein [Streptomyces sp. NPDC048277]|uniref:hypothetical protein n=1 Tax=Streptomyces sp. NPDC048277 TaxID=3155027 RepID=UPI0033C3BCB2
MGPDDCNWNVSDIATTALVNGGFVNYWQLNDSWADTNHSLYGIPTMPEGAKRMTGFNTAVNKMTQLVAKALPADMAGFNIGTNIPATSYSGSAAVDGAVISYTATDKSIGMALYDAASDSYYLVSDTGGSAAYNLASSSATAQVGAGLRRQQGGREQWRHPDQLRRADQGQQCLEGLRPGAECLGQRFLRLQQTGRGQCRGRQHEHAVDGEQLLVTLGGRHHERTGDRHRQRHVPVCEADRDRHQQQSLGQQQGVRGLRLSIGPASP